MAAPGLFIVFFIPEHGYTTSEGALTRFEVWIPANAFASIAVRATKFAKLKEGGRRGTLRKRR